MIRDYQDIALRLAARLAARDELDRLDLRVLEAYFTLAARDTEPSPASRDQTLPPERAVSPPKGVDFALLPWGAFVCKAQSHVEADPLLLGLMIAFFAYVAVLLWRAD